MKEERGHKVHVIESGDNGEGGGGGKKKLEGGGIAKMSASETERERLSFCGR